MHLHIISLFPTLLDSYLETSIMRRASEKGLLSYTTYNIADWSVRNTRRSDDRPYGGGAGTILMIEPLVNCIRSIIKQYGEIPMIYFSPRGEKVTQSYLEGVEKDLNTHHILICGHYEGIDHRIFDIFDIAEISIGDYVLSSGELAALVWIDGVTRLIPGVIDEDSLREESFSAHLMGKKEYPQYTRPEIFEGHSVPSLLLSGDHQKIQQWKQDHCL